MDASIKYKLVDGQAVTDYSSDRVVDWGREDVVSDTLDRLLIEHDGLIPVADIYEAFEIVGETPPLWAVPVPGLEPIDEQPQWRAVDGAEPVAVPLPCLAPFPRMSAPLGEASIEELQAIVGLISECDARADVALCDARWISDDDVDVLMECKQSLVDSIEQCERLLQVIQGGDLDAIVSLMDTIIAENSE